jgi:hypothetical protein
LGVVDADPVKWEEMWFEGGLPVQTKAVEIGQNPEDTIKA